MTTALQIINRAYEKAGIKPYDQTLTDAQKSTGLELLNEMLDQWEDEDIVLNHPTLAATDTVYVSKADIAAIKHNLAVKARLHYRRSPDPLLAIEASRLFLSMQAKYSEVEEMDLPKSLTTKSTSTYDILE